MKKLTVIHHGLWQCPNPKCNEICKRFKMCSDKCKNQIINVKK